MTPIFFDDQNLSLAWMKALLHIYDNGGKELSPLLFRVNDLHNNNPLEDHAIRDLLDECLLKKNLNSVGTVANTIFPESLYQLAQGNRQKLYDLYNENLPRAKALDKRNRDGLYFERLTSFDNDRIKGNQLEFLITEHNSRNGVRRSMFQASIFDPRLDHKRVAQLGFPCLQHLSFVPTNNHLTVNAFYCTQQLFDKAYGNLLGLVQLGRFMATEMHLTLTQVNCFVGVEKLERITKQDADLKRLVKLGKTILK